MVTTFVSACLVSALFLGQDVGNRGAKELVRKQSMQMQESDLRVVTDATDESKPLPPVSVSVLETVVASDENIGGSTDFIRHFEVHRIVGALAGKDVEEEGPLEGLSVRFGPNVEQVFAPVDLAALPDFCSDLCVEYALSRVLSRLEPEQKSAIVAQDLVALALPWGATRAKRDSAAAEGKISLKLGSLSLTLKDLLAQGRGEIVVVASSEKNDVRRIEFKVNAHADTNVAPLLRDRVLSGLGVDARFSYEHIVTLVMDGKGKAEFVADELVRYELLCDLGVREHATCELASSNASAVKMTLRASLAGTLEVGLDVPE